jgi:hypothetical protein
MKIGGGKMTSYEENMRKETKMTTQASTQEYVSKRDPALRYGFALFMAVAIAAIGWVMMTVGSSPTVKGASFLWLPAALQLAAGVWLGPWLGALAGGLGAYAAGILAYGGWGVVDIIMNPIAGGFANAMLPALLFRAMRIDPKFGAEQPSSVLSGAIRVIILGVFVLAAGLANIYLNLPVPWGYFIPLVVLMVAAWLLLKDIGLSQRHFLPAVGIAVFICAVSAFIGAIGATVGGKPFLAALVDPGIGWFAGDTVSAILGLYLLPLFSDRLRNAGITS